MKTWWKILGENIPVVLWRIHQILSETEVFVIFVPFFQWDVSYVTGVNATKFECSSEALSLGICQGGKKGKRKAIWGLAETVHTKYERINYFQVVPLRSWKNLQKTFQAVIINQNSNHWRITTKAWFRAHSNLVFPLPWPFLVCHLTPYKWFCTIQGWRLMLPIAVEWRIQSRNGSKSQECRWAGRKNFLLVEGIKQWNVLLRMESGTVCTAGSGRLGVGCPWLLVPVTWSAALLLLSHIRATVFSETILDGQP